MAQDQHRARAIDNRKAALDPIAHRILVNTKCVGGFFDTVGPMHPDEARIDPLGRHRAYALTETSRLIDSALISVRVPSLNASSPRSAIMA